jgi:TIR domain
VRRIFLSYRREDSEGETGRLCDRLVKDLGKESVFVDVDSIPLGHNFVEHLTAEVARCDVLLAIIGPQWLDIRDAENNRRRLDDPNDFVRVEIKAALQREIPVIPILIKGTKTPTADRLPSDLKELSLRNALDVRYASFHSDIDRLVRELKLKASITDDNLKTPSPLGDKPATTTYEPRDTSHETVVLRFWPWLGRTISGFVVGVSTVLAALVLYQFWKGQSADRGLGVALLIMTCIGAIASRRLLLRATNEAAAGIITCLATWGTAGAAVLILPTLTEPPVMMWIFVIIIIQLALLALRSKILKARIVNT